MLPVVEIDGLGQHVMARLRVLASKLAMAVAAESRARRRFERALQRGHSAGRTAASLDAAADRVVAVSAEIERVVAEAGLPLAVDSPLPGTRGARRSSRRRASAAMAPPSIGAAVDIGSNSVHLLVAVVRGHRLEPLLDVSEFLGLGAAVEGRGSFGPELRSRLATTVAGYVAQAATLGAVGTVLVGTDPLRRAADASDAAAEIEAASGIPVATLGHDEEALLTLLGVTAGRPVLRELVLVDIGGGSSEVLVVPAQGEPVAVGLPTGSARLTRQIVQHDPPLPDEQEALLAESRRLLASAPDAAPAAVIVVGGTASNLLRVVPAAALDRRITRRRVAEAISTMGNAPASEAAARFGIREDRARVMAAGAALVAAVLERYGVDRVRVLDVGIREGIVLASAHAGDLWRSQLPSLAHGWTR
jgi:exopolyphosphatase/pppGpp-phosphohydrolase